MYYGLNAQEQQEEQQIATEIANLIQSIIDDASPPSEPANALAQRAFNQQIAVATPPRLQALTGHGINVPAGCLVYQSHAVYAEVFGFEQTERGQHIIELLARQRNLNTTRDERVRDGGRALDQWRRARDAWVSEQMTAEKAAMWKAWGETLDGLYASRWPGSHPAMFTYAQVEQDVATRAWVDSPGGVATGYAANWEGKSREELVECGFSRQDPIYDYDERRHALATQFSTDNPKPQVEGYPVRA